MAKWKNQNCHSGQPRLMPTRARGTGDGSTRSVPCPWSPENASERGMKSLGVRLAWGEASGLHLGPTAVFTVHGPQPRVPRGKISGTVLRSAPQSAIRTRWSTDILHRATFCSYNCRLEAARLQNRPFSAYEYNDRWVWPPPASHPSGLTEHALSPSVKNENENT